MGAVTITCNNIHAVWQNPLQNSSFNTMAVWRIQVSPHIASLESLKNLLSLTEQQAASKFYQPDDSYRFIVRKAALRLLLAHYLSIPPQQIRFEEGDNKKPFAVQALSAGLYYNVTHSGDWILITLGNSPIGIDIEQVNTSFIYRDVLNHGFSKEEISYINRADNPTADFFTLWTRKEALTKATSKGIDDDLVEVPCLNGSHLVSEKLLGSAVSWTVSSFRVNEQYIASIAYQERGRLHFFNLSLRPDAS